MKIWYGVLLIALVLSTGCGDGESDIEATVEAKYAERLSEAAKLALEQSADATVEAKLLALTPWISACETSIRWF